jgi:hypothetical protein
VLGIVAPAMMSLLSYLVLKDRSSDVAGRTLDRVSGVMAHGGLFAAAIVLLVTTRPNRWRLAAGAGCGALKLVLAFL